MSWEDVDILLVDAEVQLRQGLRNILMQEGYRGVKDVSTVAAARDSVYKSPPDLLVVDSRMPDGDSIGMIEDIRHKRLGSNPFITIIVMVWSPNRDTVDRITRCGVDDLLVKPISPAKLMERINSLAGNRKPFIVTSEYIGPDRRTGRKPKDGEEDNSTDVPRIEVPNTLGAKAKGERVDFVELQEMVESAMYEINDQRLKRHSYRIASIVDKIVPAYQKKQITLEVQKEIARLSDIAKEVSERLAASDFGHVNDLCQTLDSVTSAIRRDPKNPDPRDVDLLKALSDAIVVSFNPEKGSAKFAAEVTEMVRKKYQERQEADGATAGSR